MAFQYVLDAFHGIFFDKRDQALEFYILNTYIHVFINYEKILSNIQCFKKYQPVQALPVLMQMETFFYLSFS